MTALTFLLRLPRLALSICGWRWQNDQCKNKVYISESTKKNASEYDPPGYKPHSKSTEMNSINYSETSIKRTPN